MATVNPNQTTTYDLTTANNPITFGTGTNINAPSDAVYGDATTGWKVTNKGVLQGSTFGVDLASQSSVTNSGSIADVGTTFGFGVLLSAGGSVTNQVGGTIDGYNGGVLVLGASGAVTNTGVIAGAGAGNVTIDGIVGVGMVAGGSVTNKAGGMISATDSGGSVSVGIYISGGVGSVTNAGVITAAVIGTGVIFADGVDLVDGGTVNNQAGGTITGANYGVSIGSASGKVTNAGAISGGATGSDAGVHLLAGGSVTNQASGSIGGFFGVLAAGAAAVTNAGVIGGASTITGVQLNAGGSVTNQSGGIIKGSGTGMGLNGETNKVSLNNQAGGTVIGGFVGVLATGNVTVTNAGSITATNATVFNGLNLAGGVQLLTGGSVTNQAGGSISGAHYGVYITVASGKVTNAGVIDGGATGSDAGVDLLAGGSVINQASGTIDGFFGVLAAGAAAVTNAGAIGGASTITGVQLNAGGSVTNQSGGIIKGGGTGMGLNGETNKVSLNNQAGGTVIGGFVGVLATGNVTVTNAGSITATNATVFNGLNLAGGVQLLTGGSVTNQAGGSISGAHYGVYVGGAGAVTNAGTITGEVASVEFLGTGANSLTLQTGSVLNGDAVGSTASGATNAVTLTGGGEADNNFDNFDTLTVKASGGAWVMDGVSTLSGAATISTGTLQVGDAAHTGANLTIDGKTTNKGVLDVEGETLDLVGAVTGAGSATIGAGTLELGSTFTENVAFTGTTGLLDLAKSQSYKGTVSGLSTSGGTEIDLRDIGFVNPNEATLAGSGTSWTLTVTDGAHTAKIALFGDYSASSFVAADDGHGGTIVHDPSSAALTPALAAPGGH